jgi:hypothetical protein
VRIDASVWGLRSVRVVGIAVLPSLGRLLADRTGLGTGAFVVTRSEPRMKDAQLPAAFTGIRLRPGTDPQAFLAKLTPPATTWDPRGGAPSNHTAPVRPPDILNVASMRAVPLAIGAVLAAGLATGLALSVGVSVRDRRRELAILRSLGFSRRDLRATVGWQAVAIVAVGLVVGIPLGVAAGRVAWREFADQLGVVPRAGVPFGWTALIALAALAVALAAAAPSARAAARVAPSRELSRFE